MVITLKLGDSNAAIVSSTDPEQLYAYEKKLLEGRRVLPLVALPEYIGLSQKVRDWMPAQWGEWHLADVWLDRSEPGATQPADSNGAAVPATQPGAAPPGAKR